MHRFALIAALTLAVAPAGLAQVVTSDNVVKPAASTPPPTQPYYYRLPGMLAYDLPSIEAPGTIKLIFNPHISDLVQRDYLRLDGGFRWAINDHFEFTPETRMYFGHGSDDSGGNDFGFGEVRLGAKYILKKWPTPGLDTSFTLATYMPIHGAPIDLTDGLNHLAPAFLVQHRLVQYPKWIVFGGAGFDLVDQSEVAGTPVENQPVDDSMSFTAGTIHDLGQLSWALTTTYATTSLIGHTNQNYFYLQPNVLWYVPRKWTFHSKTQWIFSLGARISWGPDGSQISISNRVRAEITFRQVMSQIGILPEEEQAKH